MEINLKEKVVVITGSSRGIGKHLAIRLSHENAKVVINYNKNKERAESTIREISQYNKECIAIKADVSSSHEVVQFYHKVCKRYGRVDVLINNAGICDDNLLQMMSVSQWEHVIRTNLLGSFLCCREFSKAMINQKEGKIINIASLKGQLGCEGQANYSASKGGIISMTRTLAKELGRYNISVNAICPGFIVTDLNRHNEEKRRKAKKLTAMKNRMDAMTDLENFIVYISSDYFAGISGQVFNLDSRIL